MRKKSTRKEKRERENQREKQTHLSFQERRDKSFEKFCDE